MLKTGGKLVSLYYAGNKQRSAFDHHPDLQWNLLPGKRPANCILFVWTGFPFEFSSFSDGPAVLGV
jgi:hypothetical protein